MNSKTKTIILIHGLWTTPRIWHLFRDYYEERGHRVFTPIWPRMKGEVEEIRRDPSALAGDPRLATDFFDGAETILAELNDRLTQVYFSHSELPENARRS